MQPVAISGKSRSRKNRRNKPKPLEVIFAWTDGELRTAERRSWGTHARRSEGATSARIPRGQGGSVLLSR